MAFVNGAPFDVSKIIFSAETKPNKSGGRNAMVSRDEVSGARVEFQLGKRRADAMRCPWGLDKVKQDAPEDDPRKQMKVELNAEAKVAIEKLEEATVAAAVEHSQAWFKEKKPLTESAVLDRFQSKLKTDDEKETTMLTLKVDTEGARKTVVKVCSAIGEGTYSTPVLGSYEDITPGCMVVPIVRISNGVYFVNKNFGTSLVAKELVVVKDAGAATSGSCTACFASDEEGDGEE